MGINFCNYFFGENLPKEKNKAGLLINIKSNNILKKIFDNLHQKNY